MDNEAGVNFWWTVRQVDSFGGLRGGQFSSQYFSFPC